MKNGAILFIILLLSISVYAQTIDKAALITDKRTDFVRPNPNQIFCINRTVNTGTTLIPKWSGDLTLISIDKVSYQTETYSVDVPKYGECYYTEQYLDEKPIDEKACNEITDCVYDTKNASCYCSREIPYECITGYTKEERTRQKAIYTPIQTTETKDSTYTAFESKLTTELKALPYDSKAITDTAATIRFCFKAPPFDSPNKAGEISYIAYTGTQYDTCESTWWNTSYCDALGGEISAQNISGVIYCVHNFSVSGTFNITTARLVDYLIVAGGGGGGADIQTGGGAGGGGGGGLNFSTNVSLSPGNYSVIVGTGGLGGLGRGVSNPTNGSNSSFNGVTMIGGGAGATPVLRASVGGSGGGGSTDFSIPGGTGIVGQGNDGGNGLSSSAAGGGGASSNGADTLVGDIGGDGGNGTLIPITNVSLYYAGGGGGGSYAKSGGLGGLGGGGNSSPSGTAKAFDGINGTGGGGGGGSSDSGGFGLGGNGGNGIVVIRYIITEAMTKALNVTLDTPLNNTEGLENNTFNYTAIGTNGTYNCSIYFNGTLNQTAQTGNNTLSTFNLTGLGVGEWLWNITCWIDSTTYNTSETWNYTVVLITTTTTTTTTSSTTTTQAGATTNSTLYIYAIMIPIMAFIMTLSIIVKSDQPLIIVFKPFLASILWFACSGMTVNIRFIDDFTTTLSPYYIDRGNVEVGYLFTFLAGIMAFYTITVVMIIIYELIDNKKEK